MNHSPVRFETTTTNLTPGETVSIVNEQWNDALIVVTAGSIDLESQSGTTRTFPTGSVLTFTRNLQAVHNSQTTTATITSTRRTHPAIGKTSNRDNCRRNTTR
jgi:hypothetical protein